MAGATAAGMCEKCGSEMMDVRVERSLGASQAPQRATLPQTPSPTYLPPLAQPPAATLPYTAPPPFVEDITGSAAVRTVATPAAPRETTTSIAARDALGVVGSGLMRAGFALLTLAPAGLIILLFLQWATAQASAGGLADLWGEDIFLASRGREVYVMGLGFLAMPIVAMLVCLTGMTLLPRAGRGLRIAGYCLGWLGAAGLLVAVWRYSTADGRGDAWKIAIGGLVVLMTGLLMVQAGSRSARQAIKSRFGARKLYRPWGLRTRLWVGAVLWLAGLVIYAVIMVRQDDWTLQRGGYAVGALLALGLLGAILALAGRFGRPSVWIDREGHIVQ